MKVFKYLSSTRSIQDTYEIYKVVRSLERYARTIHGDRWDDALDDAFFHTLKNFDKSKGDLENYVIKIVKTIRLNKDSEEANDEKTMLSLDKKAAKNYSSDDTFELIFSDDKSSDIKSCLNDLIRLYIKDYKFFVSGNMKDKTVSYRDFLNKYSATIIESSRKFIDDNYKEDFKKFIKQDRGSILRSFNDDRLYKSIDDSIEYIDRIKSVVLIRKRKSTRTKDVYRVDLRNTVSYVFDLVYNHGRGSFNFGGVMVYVSLSGKVTDNAEELKSFIERDLVGTVVTRLNVKIFKYAVGEELFFTCSKEIPESLIVNIMGRNIAVDLERVVIKEVS